jgi:hypothetical protein
MDQQHFEKFVCPVGHSLVKIYIPKIIGNNLEKTSESLKIIADYKMRASDVPSSINSSSNWISHLTFLKGFGEIKRTPQTVLLNRLVPAITSIQNKEDSRPIAKRLETIEAVCSRLLIGPYIIGQDFNPGKHQSTAMMLLVLKEYYNYTNNQPVRNNAIRSKKNELKNAYLKLHEILKSDAHQQLSREELFATIIRTVYPAISINTGDKWRSKTHGEQLIWDNLMPMLNEKEKILLHAEMTRARLKRDRRIHADTLDKISDIENDIEALKKADSNDLTEIKRTFLNHYLMRRRPLIRCVNLEPTSAKSFRRLMRM